MRELRVTAGVEWNALCAGTPGDPTVLFLHGFPECRRSWELQMEPLAAAGYRPVAVDLPGYGGTSAPSSYRLADIAGLTADLAVALDPGGVHLVGHDWGGIVGCAAAFLRPEAFRSCVAAAAPHPGAMPDSRKDPRQLARSWYIAVFQIPGMEYVFGGGRGALAKRLFPRAACEMTTIAEARRAIAYYRANMNPFRVAGRSIGAIKQPGLVIHAARDLYIGRRLMERSKALFEDLRGFHVLDARHFVHRERPDEFNELLIDFLGSSSPK